MSVLPVAKVEMAFGAGFTTPAASRTWTDVTAYVIGSATQSITRGRTDELSQPPPSTLSLTLLNADGRFTPGNTGGAYSPNIVKGVPIRYSVTYGATSYVRFTGYVAEWPVVWPDGSDVDSTVTITATSRLARLGQTAPLPSAIRAAYMSTSPLNYWPMDEEPGLLVDNAGTQIFADIINNTVGDVRARHALGAFSNTAALAPVLRDGSPGPEDEQSLVHFPKFTNSALVGTFAHDVGAGGGALNLAPTGLTVEFVARVTFDPSVPVGSQAIAKLLNLFDASLQNAVFVQVDGPGGTAAPYLEFEMRSEDSSGTVLSDPEAFPFPNMSAVSDNEIHHYCVTIDSTATVGKFYLDGVLLATLTLASAFGANFAVIALGTDTYYADAWIGHVAVHNRALTATEVSTHAEGATAATEDVPSRMVRIAGYLGVPAAEVSAEASVAQPLGPQAELGRTATDVLNELAVSTGGILFDARDGTLTMQARNHRYNAASAFTLSTSGQEIEADFTATLDDRYLVNTVNVTRVGSNRTTPLVFSDGTSVAQYGTYASSAQIVSTSDNEAEAYGHEQLYRYAQPSVRVNQVTVDLVDLSDSQRTAVLNASIGTLFTLSGLPSQAPGSSMSLFIEGYSESISAFGHTVTFNTTPGSTNPAWILGDSTYGVLGSTTVVVY